MRPYVNKFLKMTITISNYKACIIRIRNRAHQSLMNYYLPHILQTKAVRKKAPRCVTAENISSAPRIMHFARSD